MTVVSVGWALALSPGAPYRPVDAAALVLAVVSPLSLLWRQALPLLALSVTCCAIVVNAAAGFDIGFLAWPAWVALFTGFAVGGAALRGGGAGVRGPGPAGDARLD